MNVTVRMGREYLALGAGFAVALFDRLAVAGVLLRFWGIDSFAIWSVGIAASTMVTFFDFGLNYYFPNRLAVTVAQGRKSDSLYVLAVGNTLMSAATTIGLTVVLGFLPLVGTNIGTGPITPQVWIACALLCLPIALRMAITVHVSIYRAHDQFSRQTLAFAILDVLRILAIVGVAALGGGLTSVAIAQLLVTVVGVLAILRDIKQRFSSYRLRFGIPRRGEFKVMAITCVGYWTQSAPTTLLASLPLFAVASAVSSASALAQFALMRTLGNFLRTGVGVLTLGLGQEVGRRIGLNDRAGLQAAYRGGARFFAVQTTSAAGVLLALAFPLFQLWTGKGYLFDETLFWVTIAPTLCLPTLTLAPAVLAAANLPWPNSIGRMSQLGMSLAIFYFLPIGPAPLRMVWGLAIGEIFGLGIPITLAIYRLVPDTGLRFHGDLLIRSLLCIGSTFMAARLGSILAPQLAGLGLGLIFGGLAAISATLLLGLDRQRRQMVWSAARGLHGRVAGFRGS
jgi:O-antigen/teichoic acid export membrane protein